MSYKISFSGSLLIITQNLVTFQKFHEMTMHYIFHDFASIGCKRNWPVVGSLAIDPLL